MRYLIDTHAILWCFEGSDKLSETTKSIMLDAYTQKYVSIASIWEFAIKYGMGKIQFDGGLRHLWDLITQYNFTILPITKPYLAIMIELPFIHRDPFDRMLIATAKAENMSILTADENIHKYDVASVW